MDERRIVYVTYIASTQDAVWNALTNPEVTQLYWYGTRVESDWKVGSKVVYRRGGEVTDEHIVLAVDPPHSFRHSFHPVFAEESPQAALARRLGIFDRGFLFVSHFDFPLQ